MVSWRRRSIHITFLSFLILIIAAHWWYSPEELFGELAKSGWILIAVGVIAFYLIRPFVLWPLSLASIFLGYLVGFPAGVPIVLAGTLITSLPPFVLADYFKNENGYVSQISATGASIVNTTGELRGMIAARLSPAPADGVSIGAGLAGISGWSFVFGTLIGELPWAIFYVSIGHSLQTFSGDPPQLGNIVFLLFVTACGILLVLPPIYQKVIGSEN